MAARRAHNPEVGGSSPSPATKFLKVVFKQLLFFYSFRKIRHFFLFPSCIIDKYRREKGVIILKKSTSNVRKCGTVTVSVYKDTSTDRPIFKINSDNDEVLPVSYVIEDTLYLY